jgi:Flp pilus assembly pilin Flp
VSPATAIEYGLIAAAIAIAIIAVAQGVGEAVKNQLSQPPTTQQSR